MCTEEATRKIVKEENEGFYLRLLETIPKIISSAVNAIEHKTAPDTNRRLVALEAGHEQNKNEHEHILQAIARVEEYHKKSSSTLEEIRKGIVARTWIAETLQRWWLVGALFISLLGLWVKSIITK